MNYFIAKYFEGHPQTVKQISLFMINECVNSVAFNEIEEISNQNQMWLMLLTNKFPDLKHIVEIFYGLHKDMMDLQKMIKTEKDKWREVESEGNTLHATVGGTNVFTRQSLRGIKRGHFDMISVI